MRENILALVGLMDIHGYTALANKCYLVENCNRKLAVARSEAYKKKLAPHKDKATPKEAVSR